MKIIKSLFTDFGIAKKIALIPIASSICFGVILFISYISIGQNEKTLDSIVNQAFPVLDLVIANDAKLDRLNEAMQTAVSIGEEDMLDNVEDMNASILENFDLIAFTDPSLEDYVLKIRTNYTSYYDLSMSLTRQLINGELDFAASAGKLEEMNKMRLLVSEYFSDFRSKSYVMVTDALKKSHNNAIVALNTSVGFTVGFIFVVAIIAYIIIRGMTRNINFVIESLEQISSGNADLTRRIPPTGRDEIGVLVCLFNRFTEKLEDIIRKLVIAVQPLTKTSTALAELLQQSIHIANDQIEFMDHMKSSMTELSDNTKVVVSNVEDAVDKSNSVKVQAIGGVDLMNDALNVTTTLVTNTEKSSVLVKKLAEDSDSVGIVLDVIKGIAAQTNLLALNAAIEAARAGEYGRGFAVVSDEVRTLAFKTQQSTTEINDIIEKLQAATGQVIATMAMNSHQVITSEDGIKCASSSFREILDGVENIAGMSADISDLCGMQEMVFAKLSDEANHYSELTKESITVVSSLNQVGVELHKLIDELNGICCEFKINYKDNSDDSLAG